MTEIFSIFVAFTLGGVIMVGAMVTGNEQVLCERMGGKYTPRAAPGEVCPGGKWSNFVTGPQQQK